VTRAPLGGLTRDHPFALGPRQNCTTKVIRQTPKGRRTPPTLTRAVATLLKPLGLWFCGLGCPLPLHPFPLYSTAGAVDGGEGAGWGGSGADCSAGGARAGVSLPQVPSTNVGHQFAGHPTLSATFWCSHCAHLPLHQRHFKDIEFKTFYIDSLCI